MSIDEEIIYCLVHEIVDDVFKDPGEITTTSCTDSAAGCGVRQDTKGFEVHEGDPGAALDTADFMQSAAQVSEMASGPSINKRRRRLGVNSGAHDQIMLLRSNLEYVTEERDRFRRKCEELERIVIQLRAKECDLEEEMTRQKRFIRYKMANAPTTTGGATKELIGPSDDSATVAMQNEL